MWHKLHFSLSCRNQNLLTGNITEKELDLNWLICIKRHMRVYSISYLFISSDLLHVHVLLWRSFIIFHFLPNLSINPALWCWNFLLGDAIFFMFLHFPCHAKNTVIFKHAIHVGVANISKLPKWWGCSPDILTGESYLLINNCLIVGEGLYAICSVGGESTCCWNLEPTESSCWLWNLTKYWKLRPEFSESLWLN